MDRRQHCEPRWWGTPGGREGTDKPGSSAATAAGNSVGSVQVRGTAAAAEGNTAPTLGSKRCPGWCPSPRTGLSRKDWLDFGSLTDNWLPQVPGVHCSTQGGWAGAEELVGQLGVLDPSASGAKTVADQVQVGRSQVGRSQVLGAGSVLEQVRCQGAAQVRGSADLVVGQGELCRH